MFEEGHCIGSRLKHYAFQLGDMPFDALNLSMRLPWCKDHIGIEMPYLRIYRLEI